MQFPNHRTQSHSRMLIKRIGAGIALTAILVGSALAQCEPIKMSEGMVTFYSRTGGIVVKTMADPAFLAAVSKDFSALPSGTILMVHDGKLYMAKDKKLSDGHMLSEGVMSH